MPTPTDLQLGRLAVRRALASEDDVRECLELQRRNRAIGYDEPLTALLVKRGLIGEADRRALEDDLARALFVQGEQLFARRCVERGLLERDEARALLGELRAGGFRSRLGELLVERGKLDRAQRDAIAREVVRLQDEEDRAARPGDAAHEADDEAAPAPADVQPRALASYDRDQRRFSSSGEWVDAALPRLEGFELERRLGQGPNGVVFRARRTGAATDGGEHVALKLLAPGLVATPGFLAGIKRAWGLAQRVEHPVFVRLGAPGRQGDLVFFTMDLVDGESLQVTIDRSGPLPSERVLALVRSVLQGLERAHQVGLSHGALCPENVLIARSTGWPVVTDLALSGVGRVSEGSAGLYASPQRLTGAAPQPTPLDDVYSLACLAYFAVVGRPPFADSSPTARLVSGAPDPRDADPSIDARLAALVERGTRPEPGERLDLAQALALVETGRARAPQPPQPPRPPTAPAPPPPRPPAAPTASALATRPSLGVAALQPTAAPPPPPPPVPLPPTPAPLTPRARPQVPTAPSLAAVTAAAVDDDESGDHDRTLAMPAVLPLPPGAPPPAPPAPPVRPAPRAAPATPRAPADDADLDAVERTMEVAPPPGARLDAAPLAGTIFVAPPASALDDEEVAIERTITLSPPGADDGIERTIAVGPPPAADDAIDRTITLPPPPADDGIERTIAVSPPTGWSELLRNDAVADSRTATQPLAAVRSPGGLDSTLADPPSPPRRDEPSSGSMRRPTRPTGSGTGPAPSFDAMGETVPMKPLGAQDDLVGRLIHNRYRVVGKLGQGGMGVVYKAEHTLMGRAVAFKVLSPELVKNAESIARFKREVMAMAQFQHRNVVRIFDAGATEDGRFYMALELVDGRSLASVLHDEGPLPAERAARLLAQILRGVAEGHKRGIVHRDLKSENILLTVESGEEVVKIMDFGIAKVLWEQESPQSQSNAFLTTERMAVGTPEYMSPEQASGGARIDARSDIYSLGVVAYEMLTGRLPFDADSPVGFIGKHIIDPPIPFAERAPHLALSPAAEQLVMRALEKDPGSRFPSAEAMLVALEQAFPEHAAALRVAPVERSASRSAAPPPPPSPFGSARTSPPPTQPTTQPPAKPAPLDPAASASGEGSQERSGETVVAAPPGNKLVLRLLLALGGVAGLLLVTIVVLVVARRPDGAVAGDGDSAGDGAAVAALDPARLAQVQAALAGRRFDEARRLVNEARPDPASPAPAEVAAALARLDELEATVAKLDAVSGELSAAVDELRRAANAEDLGAAEAALARLRPLPGEAARLHARLLELEAASLAGPAPPTADVAELEATQVTPLRELEDAASMARKLLAATPPDYDAALARIDRALARTRLPARRDELQALQREARAGQLEAQARRELERTPPDYARALTLLEQAHGELPTEGIKDLLDRTRRRAADARRETADRELAERVRAAEAAVAAGQPDVAVRELQQAARLVQETGVQDTYDLPRRLAAAEAALASSAAHVALPVVGDDATAAEVEHALAARRRYLADHPAGLARAEVEAECAALERRLSGLREGSAAATFARLIDDARAAMKRRAWDEARALAQEAVDVTRGAPDLDAAPARELLVRIDEREALLRALEADFVPVGALRVARYEVTNSEYFAFCVRQVGLARAAKDPTALERARALWPEAWAPSSRDPDIRQFPSGTSQLPVGGVSFRDAEQYCAWRAAELGVPVRLPTEAEWLQAAGGDDGRPYPWGATFDPNRVTFRRLSEGPVPVTAELQGQSPFDLRHMAGNVAEWVDTVWDDPQEGRDPSSRLLKGGSFRSMNPENLRLDARIRGGVTERKPEWGFRVVVEAGE